MSRLVDNEALALARHSGALLMEWRASRRSTLRCTWEFPCNELAVATPEFFFNTINAPNRNENGVTEDAQGRKTSLIKIQAIVRC